MYQWLKPFFTFLLVLYNISTKCFFLSSFKNFFGLFVLNSPFRNQTIYIFLPTLWWVESSKFIWNKEPCSSAIFSFRVLILTRSTEAVTADKAKHSWRVSDFFAFAFIFFFFLSDYIRDSYLLSNVKA